MELHYKKHSCVSSEFYLAPLALHENLSIAHIMIKHFNHPSIGIFSNRELDEFKLLVQLHGHTLVIVE